VEGPPRQSQAVVLVGFMGAGKTAVGEGLAGRLGLPFLDTDDVIVAAHGPISAIFAGRGEAGFRKLETEVVVREIAALEVTPKVLALGGGAVLIDQVRRALRRVRRVVWLTAPPETLWARVASEGQRPLARDEESFRGLLATRETLYREVATLVVDTAGLGPGEVAEAVVSALDSGRAEAGLDGTHEEGAA
jgi:shikimate kinase